MIQRTLTMTLIATIATAAVGCNANSTEPPVTQPPVKTQVSTEELPNMPTTHPAVDTLDVLSRGPRRMSVEQVERAIEVAGNLPRGSVQIPPNLALTLGEPDYLAVTEVSLETSPLFLKFMVDLGGFLCTDTDTPGLASADMARPVEERVFTRYETLDENLRYVMLRWTGIEGENAAPYVERLTRVYESAAASARGEVAGWEAVCMTVFTSPEFLLY